MDHKKRSRSGGRAAQAAKRQRGLKKTEATDARLGIFIVQLLRALRDLSGRDSHLVGLAALGGPVQEIRIEVETRGGRMASFSASASHYASVDGGPAKLAKILLSWPSPAAEIGAVKFPID